MYLEKGLLVGQVNLYVHIDTNLPMYINSCMHQVLG